METKYNHQEVQKGKNEKWIQKKYFSTHDVNKEPFTIILPPPNVTGKLHLGHAWDGFIQDTIIRYKKLKGFDVLFVPGMDHAGIATQAKVEAKMRDKKMPTRFELGREKFLDLVQDWKEEYASIIRKQWSKLGLALDYTKERFTMDKGLVEAVQKVFIKMYKDKLIYRGIRPINWDPKLKTVLSNIEVISKETKSQMFYINYPLEDSQEFVQIATTRPETMFSDVAIAINPKDKKLKHLIGKNSIHPLTKRKLPIITDDSIELGKGTGAMKVSAHAIVDFAIIKKNNLELIECIDENGIMNKEALEFENKDRFETRKLVVQKLDKMKLLVKTENIINAVGYSERSGEVVEILVQPQWFVAMETLAKQILENINSKDKVNFVPSRFENTIKQWMEEIEDWTISRQLWWGHRLPVWYKGKEVKVQIESPGKEWEQDNDVLDTWFSSGIAPFSFLGWPNDTKSLKRYYPTNLLVTGYDIIFFWVARMYFQGLQFMKEIPFKEVLIHGLIRDEEGRKMSKSLGNGIDPMEVIDKYGADSLRWFLLTNSKPGQDIRYSTEKIEAAWNLQNKIWNISRYIIEIMPNEKQEVTSADLWIKSKLVRLQKIVDDKMKTYDFTIIGKEITNFIMEELSSWYIELSKSNPNREFAIGILKDFLVILHPFMPFISDHIFNLIDKDEILEQLNISTKFKGSDKEIDDVIGIVKEIREFRTTNNISPKKTLDVYVDTKLSINQKNYISKIANISHKENNDVMVMYDKIKIFISLPKEIKDQINKQIQLRINKIESEIKRAKGILSNKGFLAKAPKSKVDLEKSKLEKFENELKELQEKYGK